MRMDFAVHLYHQHHQATLAASTLRSRSYDLEHFVEVTKNPEIRRVTSRHVTAWLASMDIAASTLRKRLSTLRAFFRWAVERRMVKVDPTQSVKTPRQPRATPRSLSGAQIADLYSALPDARARLIITLMLDMGLRVGEVSRLEMADVDQFAGVARIVGKGGHERLLPITDSVRTCLTDYIGERGRGGGPVVRSKVNPRLGIGRGRIMAMVAEWMTEAGVKVERFDGRSAHALRHSMAENLYRHEVDLRTIAAALGHAQPSTTWIYLRHRASVEDLRQVMGRSFIDEPRPTLKPVPTFNVTAEPA